MQQATEIQAKIIAARHRQGITQEELAEKAKVNVRTIQRMEKGTVVPRVYTLKAIAQALDIPYHTLLVAVPGDETEITPLVQGSTTGSNHASQHHDGDFLQWLCLSCFTYLVLPYIHFLLPTYMLNKQPGLLPESRLFGRRLIKTQIKWLVGLHLSLLLALAYNTLQASYWGNHYPVNYVWVLVGMYLINLVIIATYMRRAKTLLKAD